MDRGDTSGISGDEKYYARNAKKNIDCTQIVKDIRQQYDDIICGPHPLTEAVSGSRSKKTKTLFAGESKETENQPLTDAAETVSAAGTDLVASANGVITSMITRIGTPLVHVGDTVEEGQILVTGRGNIKRRERSDRISV